MTNGEKTIVKCNSCLSVLQDFYDFIIDSQCPDFKLVSRVAGSLEAINALSDYLVRIRVGQILKEK